MTSLIHCISACRGACIDRDEHNISPSARPALLSPPLFFVVPSFCLCPCGGRIRMSPTRHKIRPTGYSAQISTNHPSPMTVPRTKICHHAPGAALPSWLRETSMHLLQLWVCMYARPRHICGCHCIAFDTMGRNKGTDRPGGPLRMRCGLHPTQGWGMRNPHPHLNSGINRNSRQDRKQSRISIRILFISLYCTLSCRYI